MFGWIIPMPMFIMMLPLMFIIMVLIVVLVPVFKYIGMVIPVGTLNYLFEFTPVKPYAPAIWAMVNFYSLGI